MSRDIMTDLFREQSQTIFIYPAVISVADPIKKNTERIYLNPVPIKAMVTNLILSQIVYRMPGIETSKAKEVLINERDNSLIEMSYKIEIDSEIYYAWKDNAGENIQKRKEGSYYRILVYKK